VVAENREWTDENELVKRIMFVASQFNFNYDFSPQKRMVAALVKLCQ